MDYSVGDRVHYDGPNVQGNGVVDEVLPEGGLYVQIDNGARVCTSYPYLTPLGGV